MTKPGERNSEAMQDAIRYRLRNIFAGDTILFIDHRGVKVAGAAEGWRTDRWGQIQVIVAGNLEVPLWSVKSVLRTDGPTLVFTD